MDSWDDDDYQVPVVAAVEPKVPTLWDDDEEEDEPSTAKNAVPLTEKQIQALQREKKAQIDKIAAAHEAESLKDETLEQRRLRERLRAEEADKSITEDLFGGSNSKNGSIQSAAGLASISLKTTQDHVQLALDLSERLKVSSTSNILVLFKELLIRVQPKLSLEETNQLALELSKIKDVKIVADKKKKALLLKQQQAKDKKNEEMTKKKTHERLYGGGYNTVGDVYDEMAVDYLDAYDDFM